MSNKANTNKSAIEQRVNELVQHSRTLELYLNEVLERESTVTKLIEEARLASYALQNIPLDKENEALMPIGVGAVSYTHLRAHETPEHLVCRLLLEKKNQ